MYNSMNLYKDKFYIVPYFKDMVVERIKFSDFDKNLIIRGLEKFAIWAKQNYKEENIKIKI